MQAIIGSQYPEIVIQRINEAKTEIDIIVFDWRWYANDPGSPVQLFNQSLVRAVRRGVRVRAIVNNESIAQTLKALGIEAKKLQTNNLVHAKIIIIDKKEAIIGSHNFTSPAFEKNYELSALIDDQNVVSDYSLYFNNLWQ
jgi:phosphatidylserine/phosphatidylglycerophosphate/cardiolipin synthase-like enzyme